jgi:hypothetical protein
VVLHRVHFDGRQQVVDEGDVFASEFATIHQAALDTGRLRSTVGTLGFAAGS